MKKPSEAEGRQEELLNRIIGLGEKSIRKSYYPELQQKLRELEQEVAERERRELQLQRNFKSRTIINDLLKLSLEEIPLDALFEKALEKIITFDWLDSGTSAAIFLLDELTGLLVKRASIGFKRCTEQPCQEVSVGECLCGLAASTGAVQFASRVDERHTIRSTVMAPHGHYCVPIQLGEKTVGVLSLYLPDGHVHDQGEEGFLTSIATSLAGIIQRERINEDKKQFERLLLQSQKIEALGTLSGGIAHDFNNLLAPMLGYAELALKDLEPGSRAEKRIGEVIKAATRAKDLVRQILSLSHQGILSSERTPLRLDQVVDDVFPLIRASIPATIDIRLNISRGGCRVLADTTQINQILLNLCTNAYHALRDSGGAITINLRQARLDENDLKIRSLKLAMGDYQVLEVNDNGCGMAQETLDRIFDPYFTTKKQGEGTGLGLAVVNGIVSSYGGMISVYSEPGQGTSFHIYLPCTEAEIIEAKSQTSVLPVGTERILLVDDEQQVGLVACETLETLGYETILFNTCAAAIQAFGEEPEAFDLVITDMTMPKMTGLELANCLRAIRPDLPMILCTGFSEQINEQKAHASGFQRYLLKPILIRDLAHAVRDVLDADELAPPV